MIGYHYRLLCLNNNGVYAGKMIYCSKQYNYKELESLMLRKRFETLSLDGDKLRENVDRMEDVNNTSHPDSPQPFLYKIAKL